MSYALNIVSFLLVLLGFKLYDLSELIECEYGFISILCFGVVAYLIIHPSICYWQDKLKKYFK